MNKTIENLKFLPEYVCADAGYHTRRTLEYIEETGLNILIDDNRSAKLRNGHANGNKFHKDNMDYNVEDDYFTCYVDEKLTYQKTNVRWDEKRKDWDIQRIYYNKKACKGCKYAEKCCGNKYRSVRISGGILALKMLAKFEDYENVMEYVKRFSTVEAPNGTLKTHYHINELLSANLTKSQNKINICGGSYNLKRLYNQFMEKDCINSSNILDFVKKICDKTNVIMFISRNTTFHFMDELLQLPYICESCLPKSNKINEYDLNQTTLIEV